MAAFRTASDLVTILKTITMANVSTLTERCIIKLEGGEDADGDEDSGELIIQKEIYTPIRVNNKYRHELHTMPATYYYSDINGVSEDIFKDMLEEMDRTLEVLNQPNGNIVYSMTYTWNTNLAEPVADIIFTVLKQFVSVIA